jgi:Glycosyl transferases group 1
VHVALVLHGLPQPSSLGGPMTAWALLEQLRAEGHRATVVALRYPEDPFYSADREEAVQAELRVVPVEVAPAGAAGTVPLRGRPSIFPTRVLADELTRILDEVAPHAVFAYHWDTLAPLRGRDGPPRLGVVDDLWHMPNLRRWQRTRPAPSRAYVYWTLSTLRGLRPTARAMAEVLGDCAAAGAFQAETAAWLRRHGVPGCEYLHAPIADGGRPEWAARRRERENGRPKILLGPSQLGATSTRAGLRLFAREILPALERELGPDGFVVRVVGEGEPPPELAALLPRPSVELTGRIEPADDEFLRCDVQLVPTPYVLGKRVRIIVGWSFGCCVVAHTAEAVNLPELRDGKSGLLGSNGEEIAHAVVRALRDPDLARRIGEGGRRAYEENFHPAVAARAIILRLQDLARAQ